MPKPRNKSSKRQTLHQQHKVKKKVAEHHRKQRKEAKKNIVEGKRKTLKKDPGIPNLYPYKEELLQKFEARKLQLEDEQKAARAARIEQSRKARLENKPSTMEKMMEEAQQRSKDYQDNEEKKKEGGDEEREAAMYDLKDGSKKAYFREFKKIVEQSDVILEVLDARDPMGCRCPDVEQKIVSKHPNKKIIFILNKIDLIPKDNVESWLKYLRNEFPTIAFKCSTQDQRRNLGQANISTSLASSKMLDSSECLGAETLLQLLKNYSRNSGMKTALSVGIIGYPNVGKSSLINSLKRTRSVGVGSTPGFTKTIQEIQLDKSIKLLDSPGIVFGKSARHDGNDSDIVLRNAVKVEKIVDPISPVELIIKRCKKDQLMNLYSLHEFANVQEFLIQIAGKRGKLKKGGVANIHAAAKTILQDWNAGKIPFFTVPPKVKGVHLAAQIVKEYSKGFNLEEVFKNEKNAVIAGLPDLDGTSMMQLESSQAQSSNMLDEEEEDNSDDEDQMSDEEDEEEEEEDEMEEDEEEEEEEEEKPAAVPVPKAKPVKQNLKDESDKYNPQRNRDLKKQLKKNKKLIKKASNDDSYDFSEHFGDDDDSDLDLDDV